MVARIADCLDSWMPLYIVCLAMAGFEVNNYNNQDWSACLVSENKKLVFT